MMKELIQQLKIPDEEIGERLRAVATVFVFTYFLGAAVRQIFTQLIQQFKGESKWQEPTAVQQKCPAASSSAPMKPMLRISNLQLSDKGSTSAPFFAKSSSVNGSFPPSEEVFSVHTQMQKRKAIGFKND